jgi:phosphoserine phosphatase
MAEKTYIVKHESLTVGDLRNRTQVDKAVDEGRVVNPVPEYQTLSAGDEVQLDEDRAKSLVESGAVEPKSSGSKSKSDSG